MVVLRFAQVVTITEPMPTSKSRITTPRGIRIHFDTTDKTLLRKVTPFKYIPWQTPLVVLIFTILSLPVRAIPVITSRVTDGPSCTAATWEEIVVFILINYVTHAVTVNTDPGEESTLALFFHIAALLLPFTGAVRGMRSIISAAILADDPLQCAERASALCIVTRSQDWHPQGTEEVSGCEIVRPDAKSTNPKARVVISHLTEVRKQRELDPHGCKIHGQYRLPPGYRLSKLWLSHVLVKTDSQDLPIQIACSYSFPKVVASIIQLCSAVITLYHTRGTQLQQYGYAAFGLSVIQYAIMSFINLLGNLLCPDYPTLYMIRSEVMKEAEARGGYFAGTVGVLVSEAPDNKGEVQRCGREVVRFNVDSHDGKSTGTFSYQDNELLALDDEGEITVKVPAWGPSVVFYPPSLIWCSRLAWTLLVLATVVPYAIIGGLTKYRPESSTSIQRGFMMSWLVVGQVGGFFTAFQLYAAKNWREAGLRFLIPCILFGVPAIGGFVIVVLMMRQVGYCVDV